MTIVKRAANLAASPYDAMIQNLRDQRTKLDAEREIFDFYMRRKSEAGP